MLEYVEISGVAESVTNENLEGKVLTYLKKSILKFSLKILRLAFG